MRRDEAIKLFGLNNLTVEAEIRRIEEMHDIDLGHRARNDTSIDTKYYPQFSEHLRHEAETMALNPYYS